METIYLPTSRNYQNSGTPVKCCFEGRVTKGKLIGYDAHKRVVQYQCQDGTKQWAHESLVTLDR